MTKNKLEFMALGGIVGMTVLSGFILSRPRTAAVSYSDQATVTVSASCTFRSGGGEYTDNITSGQTKTLTGNQVETVCNDHAGYAVYAIGFSDDSYDGAYHTDMRANIGDLYNIKTDGSAGGGSYWKMRITNASNATIAGSFASFQQIPSTFTKVISYTGNTNSGAFTPEYQVYSGASQLAAVYTGKVKYVLVHPNTMTAGTYSINYLANGGSGTMSPVTGLYNFEEQEVAANGFTAPSGYKFAGWCSTNTAGYYACDGTTYAAGDTLPASPSPSATAGGALNLYAYWEEQTYLQNLSADKCTTTMSTAIDSRDGTEYHIQRLADGNCWLLDNLALDLTNPTVLNGMNENNTHASNTTLGYLKGTTTGTTSDQYATAKVANWTYSYSYSAPLVNMTNKDVVPTSYNGTDDPMKDRVVAGSWKVGGYYNYCAASAGSYCYGNGTSAGTPSGNATEDICPKGWRMPTTGNSGEYQTLYSNTNYNPNDKYREALRLPLSGYFYNGSARNQGSDGHWWSSTRYGSIHMYFLLAYTSSIDPFNSNGRDRGLSVRCVLGP